MLDHSHVFHHSYTILLIAKLHATSLTSKNNLLTNFFLINLYA